MGDEEKDQEFFFLFFVLFVSSWLIPSLCASAVHLCSIRGWDVAEYVTVAQVGEIPDGGRKVVEVGETYVLIANVEGEYRAIEDVCTHDGNELSDGVIEGHTIECSRHGAIFDLRTGRGTFPAVMPVATYPVRIEGDAVQIEVDDAE